MVSSTVDLASLEPGHETSSRDREAHAKASGFRCRLVILFNVACSVMNARKTRLPAAKAMGVSRTPRAVRHAGHVCGDFCGRRARLDARSFVPADRTPLRALGRAMKTLLSE